VPIDDGAAGGPRLGPAGIVVVGAGIAGLYASMELAARGHDVTLLEALDRAGGRIQSSQFLGRFTAEWGPMRFELGLQPRFHKLCRDHGIHLDPYPSYGSPALNVHYELRDDERQAEEQDGALGLMKLGLSRIFGQGDDYRQWLHSLFRGDDGPRDESPTGDRYSARLAEMEALLDRVEEVERAEREQLDLLRRVRLEGKDANPPLSEVGLWNALNEVLSAAAVSKIRDYGRFYHLVHENPSALEWGIFWLRGLSDRGGLMWQVDPEAHPSGVSTLVDRLVEQLRAGPGSGGGAAGRVYLELGQEVLGIRHGPHPTTVVLDVRDRGTARDYVLEAAHLILALPQMPLKRLAALFPDRIRDDLDSVLTLDLLKAFLVAEDPWWGRIEEEAPSDRPTGRPAGRPATVGDEVGGAAQRHAGLVPARELHFKRPKTVDGRTVGMAMLYTDRPAISFWAPFLAHVHEQSAPFAWESGAEPGPPTDPARGPGPDVAGLKRALVRVLLDQADQPASLRVNEKSLVVLERIRGRFPECPVPGGMSAGPQPVSAAIARAAPEWKESLNVVLRDVLGTENDEGDDDWVQRIQDEQNRATGADRARALEDSVLAFGIRDWSRPPFGGAAHAWRPGHDAVEVARRLQAFGLVGREGITNVHVCGEAYSDFQGFIEGALRSAQACVDRVQAQIEG